MNGLEDRLGWQLAGLVVLGAFVASSVLFLVAAGSCVSSDGWRAIYCGNAKGRGLSLVALPIAVAIVGCLLGLLVDRLLGRTSRTLWWLIASATAATVAALTMLYVFGDPPPGFGPGWGD